MITPKLLNYVLGGKLERARDILYHIDRLTLTDKEREKINYLDKHIEIAREL